MVGQRTFCLGGHVLPEAFKTTGLPNPGGAFLLSLLLSSPTPNHHTHTKEQLEIAPSRCSKSSPLVACPVQISQNSVFRLTQLSQHLHSLSSS